MEEKRQQKSSISKSDVINISCSICNDTLTVNEHKLGCYNDRQAAIETCRINNWKILGELAICFNCWKETPLLSG